MQRTAWAVGGQPGGERVHGNLVPRRDCCTAIPSQRAPSAMWLCLLCSLFGGIPFRLHTLYTAAPPLGCRRCADPVGRRPLGEISTGFDRGSIPESLLHSLLRSNPSLLHSSCIATVHESCTTTVQPGGCPVPASVQAPQRSGPTPEAAPRECPTTRGGRARRKLLYERCVPHSGPT